MKPKSKTAKVKSAILDINPAAVVEVPTLEAAVAPPPIPTTPAAAITPPITVAEEPTQLSNEELKAIGASFMLEYFTSDTGCCGEVLAKLETKPKNWMFLTNTIGDYHAETPLFKNGKTDGNMQTRIPVQRKIFLPMDRNENSGKLYQYLKQTLGARVFFPVDTAEFKLGFVFSSLHANRRPPVPSPDYANLSEWVLDSAFPPSQRSVSYSNAHVVGGDIHYIACCGFYSNATSDIVAITKWLLNRFTATNYSQKKRIVSFTLAGEQITRFHKTIKESVAGTEGLKVWHPDDTKAIINENTGNRLMPYVITNF